MANPDGEPTSQRWSAERYGRNARFVSDLGAPLLALLAPQPGEAILDLGCGDGVLSRQIADSGATVIAVDHSPRMLEAARPRVASGQVEFRRGEMEQLPLEDDEVDAAFANLVWHHLADVDRAAHEVARVVRPGGVAVVTDLLPHQQDWMRVEMGDHRLGIQPEVVCAALARAGFRDLVTEAVQDRYVVEPPAGEPVQLPLFLVRGVCATDPPSSTIEQAISNKETR